MQCSCKSQGNTRTNGRQNYQSSRGQLWHNPKDKSTWLLYFSEFNSWLGFPPGAQVMFILGTSLLAGPEALQTGPFQKYMSLNISLGGQIEPVRTTSLRSDQSDCPRTVFTKMGITLSMQLQLMCRLLHMKVDLISFPSMYNTWGRT